MNEISHISTRLGTRGRWIVGIAVVVVVLWIISSLGIGTNDQPGSPAVYDRIASTTDCDELRATFDRAAANNDRADPGTAEHEWTLGYMKAADDRMEAVGCNG